MDFFFCQNKKALPLIIYLDFKDTKNKAQNSLKWTQSQTFPSTNIQVAQTDLQKKKILVTSIQHNK